MLIQKKFLKIKNSQLISHYNKQSMVHLWVLSWWWTTHPVALKSIAKVPNQKVARWPKSSPSYSSSSSTSSSSSSSSSDGLVQNCVTLSRCFLHKTAALTTEQCTSPSLFFSRFEVSWGSSNRSLKNYDFLCDAIFSSCVRMRTNHLAMKCNYYRRWLN